MNEKQLIQELYFLCQEEIEVLLANQKIQDKVRNFIVIDYKQEKKIAYVKKLIATKLQPKSKKHSVKELTKLVQLPQRVIRFLRNTRKKNYELFIKLHKEITNIGIDPSKDHITKFDRITKLLLNLSNNRKSGISYNTYNYQQMLALISENARIDRKQLQNKMQIQEKAVMRNIKKLKKECLVVEEKQGRKFVYSVSKKGQLQANQLTLSFLNRGFNNVFNNTHFKNDSVPPKDILCSERIAQTKKIDKQLRDLGIYAPRVREFLEKHTLEHIESLYQSVINQDRIENKGAYIYKSLSDSCPKSQRIKGFINLHLKNNVSQDVCSMFAKETKDLNINLALWLGCSLKRLAKKATVLPCHVHTALHRIYKQMAGTTNESCPAGANSESSYVARNKKHEEIRVVMASSSAQLPQAVGCFG